MKTFSFGFYDYIPEKLEENHLYISMKYKSISHLCPCGCGNRVVTTLSPVRWKIIFDGESVSLSPSIGNWDLPCQSHYWIKKNEIHWANIMTEKAIAEVRKHDNNDRKKHTKKRRNFLWW